jgi:hypothetical protein
LDANAATKVATAVRAGNKPSSVRLVAAHRLRLRVVVVAALLIALACSSSASPTAPGRNGLIAFVTHTYSAKSGHDDLPGNGLAVVRADGTGFRKLTRNRRDRSPAWSPSGRFLAFERAGNLYVIGVNGTGLRLLTRRPFDNHHDPTCAC